MKTREEIGAVLKDARLFKGYSRQKLGELIGYTGRCDNNVYSFESGKTYPPYERLRALHEVLGVPYEDMIP